MKSLQKPDHLTVQSSECGFLRRLSLRLKPEVVFLYFALVFGLSLLVTVPPFQAPDEQHHFFRAYQVSEGVMVGDHFRAEYLPKSLKQVWQVTSRVIPIDLDRKITPGIILAAFHIPLNADDRSVITSYALPYSPHFYFPQGLGLFVGRELGLGPLALLYLGRLCTLVFCIWLFYWSIKKTPVLKWVFCLIAATPTNMSLAASCSQDAIISGLAFLFTASVLDLALSPEKEFTAGSVLFPAIVGALLAPAKAGAYAPMLAFFLFVPVRKAGSLTRYLGLVTLGAMPALFTFAAWTLVSQHQVLSMVDQVPGLTGRAQLWGILEAPQQFLWLLVKTTTGMYRGYVAQFVGVLGWVDTILPRWIIVTYLALFFTGAVLDDSVESRVSIQSKVVAGLVITFVYVGFQTIHYTFTPQDSTVIVGFLGRYLIPLGPAFFLLFHNRHQSFGAHFTSLFPIFIATFMLAVIPATLLTVVNRYYGQEQATWKMWPDRRAALDSRFHVALTSPNDFCQTFECPFDGLTGVSVAIVNSGLRPDKMRTHYTFALKDAVSGELVREVSIQSFTLDRRFHLDILFDPILDSKNKNYKFTISPTDTVVEAPISIRLSEPSFHTEDETVVYGRKTDRSVVFELIFRSSGQGR